MEKLIIIFLALILSGCAIDTSANKEIKVDSSFQFNEDEMYIDVRKKAFVDPYLSEIYIIYTTSEQTAFLLSGFSQFTTKLNDIEVEKIDFEYIEDKFETSNDTIYALYLNIEASDEQLEQIGPSITSLNISYKDQPIINFNHSPIYVEYDPFEFGFVGGYKENEGDVAGLGLENNSLQDLHIKQLFIEGINGKRFVIRDEPILFKQKDTIKLPFNRQVLEQQQIEGVVGVYALLEDGQEIFLTEGPFTIENYSEQMIEKLIQSIGNE